MKQIAFFVHPEYALKVESNQQDEYFNAVRQAIHRADVSVLVNSLVRNQITWYGEQHQEMKSICKFDELFDPANVLISNSFEINGEFEPYGHINRTSWDSLRKIIAGQEHFSAIINGCFSGNGCLLNLALQLWGFVGTKELWYDWGDAPKQENNIEDSTRRLQVKGNRYFELADIKYGVCFSMKSIDDRTNVVDGSLEQHLVKPDTVIFGV